MSPPHRQEAWICLGAGVLLSVPCFNTSKMRRRVGSAMAWSARSSEVSEDMPTTNIAKIDSCQCTTTSSRSGCTHPRSVAYAWLLLLLPRHRVRVAHETVYLLRPRQR